MVPLETQLSQTPPLIPEYFAGREVFITGATGFMGKVLLERLLWTCPDISHLHLLMRRKKDVEPEERLKELKQSQVFDVIRQHCPERLEKLSVVAGDIAQHMFNMDSSALQQLSQVTVVFHVAATIKFDEPLPVAVQQNIHPVNTIMDICDQLPKVQVFIYVSTAYSNAEQSSVEERVYPAPASLQQLQSLVDNLPEHILADVTPKLVSPKPNTYAFTKAVAESVMADRAHSSNYVTAIFRPSIVVASLQNPFPGWVDNLHGPNGIVVAIGKGLLHVAPIIGHVRADMIPVDIVIDTLIAVAWEVGIDNDRETRVYNCSSCDNPQTWEQFRERVVRLIRKHPSDDVLWYPFVFYTTKICYATSTINHGEILNTRLPRIGQRSKIPFIKKNDILKSSLKDIKASDVTIFVSNGRQKLLFSTANWIFHKIPLHTTGFLFSMLRVKQRIKLSTVCHRIQATNDAFKFFTTREWWFSTSRVKRLKARLAEADAAVYNVDPLTIDWESHCVDYVKGLRKFVLREKEKDLVKAHTRMRLLYIIHQAIKCLMAFYVVRLALKSTYAILKTICPR